MFPFAKAFGILAIFPLISHSAVIINEIDYDNVITDNAEFIELFNDGPTAVDISGYVIVGINGNGNTVYNVFATVPAATSVSAGGYYVIGSSLVASRNLTFVAPADNIQNGSPDAVGLYSGGTFAVGNPSTTNNSLLVSGILYEGAADPINYPNFTAPGAALADSNSSNFSFGRDGTGSFAVLIAPTPGAVNAAPVPEPTVPLLAGLAALGMMRRRR